MKPKIFDSKNIASKETGVPRYSIDQVLKGLKSEVKGYKFELA